MKKWLFEEDEEGHYGILFNDFEISEAPGIVSAESYDMIIPDSILDFTLSFASI